MKILLFDTETTGLVVRGGDYTHPNQPEPAQIAAILADENKIYAAINLIVQVTVPIPEVASNIHGVTDEIAAEFGVPRRVALSAFNGLAKQADRFVCHNFDFDSIVIKALYHREKVPVLPMNPNFCTMKASTNLCKIPSPWKRGKDQYKWPKLSEVYEMFIDPAGFEGAHDAMNDVKATYEVWKYLRANGLGD